MSARLFATGLLAVSLLALGTALPPGRGIAQAAPAGVGIETPVDPAAPLPAAPLEESLRRLEQTWSHINYEVGDPQAQQTQMTRLIDAAAAVAAQNPGHAEPLVWQALALCSEAGFEGGLGALRRARQARELFEQAARLDYRALNGAIPISLGSLYAKVPGFPLGFGDDTKARRYLEEGLAINPDGLDSNYFYGDFLLELKDYGHAAVVLTHALAAPPAPDRPVWDAGRRGEVRALLARAQQKLAANQ